MLVSSYGLTILPVTADIGYIMQGIYTWRTGISSILWVIGSVSVLIATGIGLIHRVHETVPDRYAGMLLLAGGCLYPASVLFQFGPLFHGPAGISVPFGIPMLMAVGYVTMTGLFGTVQSSRDPE